MPKLTELILCRHGETSWSLSGQHTGLTDLPLSDIGVVQATRLKGVLAELAVDHVFVSPLLRAKQTCALAGFEARAIIAPEAAEWDYGEYEGLTHAQISAKTPSWDLFTQGTPHGESAQQVAKRADQLIKRCQGKVLIFSHGHFLRMLAARWLRMAPEGGKLFSLSVASVSVLGWEREQPVIKLWNGLTLR